MRDKIIALGIVLVFLLSATIGTASALSNSGGSDWKYYKEITVKENSGESLTDYQVLVELNPANFPANAKSDGSDMRFFASSDGSTLTDGLVAYYTFNGNANDESGNGNHGMVHGATLTNDRFGNPNSAYYFDGVGDYIIATGLNFPSFGNSERTLSAWFRTAESDGIILTVGNGEYMDDAFNQEYAVAPTTQGVKLYAKKSSNDYYFSNSPDYTDDTWRHIVVTKRNDRSYLYIDGAFVGKTSPHVWDTGNAHIIIGVWSDWNRYFDGVIDEVRIYNRALSDTEIQSLYGTETQELSYWIEEWNYPNNAKIWVKVPSIPANGETKIKMYYGNEKASAVSEGDKVFEFFDDFDRTSLDANKWSVERGSPTVTSSNVLLHRETVDYIKSITNFPIPAVAYAKIKKNNLGSTVYECSNFYVREDVPSNPDIAMLVGYYDSSRCGGVWSSFDTYDEGKWLDYHCMHIDVYDNSYHEYQIIVTSNMQKGKIDDTEAADWTTPFNAANQYQIVFDTWDTVYGTRASDMYVDFVYACKYTSPEPTTIKFSPEYPTTKPTPAITPTPTPPTPPSGKIKAVWLYDVDKYDTATLITDLTSAGVNTIFLSTDVNNIWKHERFVKSAHENGIEVHAMILEDPRCALKENHKSAIKAVETVLDYNDKSLAKFDGINIDTEPYVDLDLEQVWQDYITLLEAIHEKTAGKTVLSADIPRWYDGAKIKDIAPNVDFFAIMAYDSGGAGWNTASEIEDAVASEMGAIRGEDSKAVIGIGVHEGFEDKEEVEKCVDGLYRYYSGDSAFRGVSLFKYESYSGLAGASEAPTEGIPEIPTGEEKGIPGFEAIIAMVGLLAVAYVLRRRK